MSSFKSCDLLIDYYFSYQKSFSIEKFAKDNSQANDEDNAVGEDSFEKSAKKFYSCFENGISFSSVTWATHLSTHWCIYSFSIFTEPLRVVLTPPPNYHLV
ncbi:hypothetical protein [Mucilaginibacter phyllosphaerae]